MRIIYIDVCGFELRQSGKSGGVQGEKNATVLQIKFDDSWAGLGKRIVWRDATGENPTPVVLFDPTGTKEETLSYATAIPAAALAYPGWCSFTIEGYTMRDGHTVKAMGAVGALEVRASEVVYQPEDAVPSETEQIMSALGAAETAMEESLHGAESSAEEAKSWAVGGTESREGEDTDNAMYYAGKAAEDAEKAENAATAAEAAEEEAAALLNELDAAAKVLPAGSVATAEYDRETRTVTFGIPTGPKGEPGPQGAKGERGETGLKGDRGEKGDNGACIPLGFGMFAMSVSEEGHLLVSVNEEEPFPPLEIDPETGHLMYKI